MQRKTKVNAGTGGQVKNLTVAGVVTGGVGNEHTGPAPPAQSLNLDDADLEVNGPSGSLQAENAQVVGLVEGGINNKYNTGNKETKSKKKDEVCYKMDAEPRGLCYIFNNNKFENRDSRTGTENDKDELVRVFRNLKFKVETIDNSGADDMEAKLKELSEISHKDFDCVVVIFLTHGKEGAIQGSDNKCLRVSTITSYFKSSVCPTLAEKPKLFFFQSCRGTTPQKGVKVDGDDDAVGAAGGDEGEKLVAPEADFFFGYSTVSGKTSLRNVKTGSWYIQELTKTLDEFADDEDLLSMMTTVKRRVNDRKSECKDGSVIKQTAEMTSRLLKKLYF